VEGNVISPATLSVKEWNASRQGSSSGGSKSANRLVQT